MYFNLDFFFSYCYLTEKSHLVELLNKQLSLSLLLYDHIYVYVYFQVYIRDCSMVSVYSLLLFCGDSLFVNLEKGVFVVSIDDGWIRFSASSHEVRNLILLNLLSHMLLATQSFWTKLSRHFVLISAMHPPPPSNHCCFV